MKDILLNLINREDNEIKCGVIFDPIKNEMFYAEKGNGAYLNNSRIRVSNKKKLKDALLVTGGPKNSSKIKEEIFSEFIKVSNNVLSPIRKFGSAALDVAYVSCGRFDGYWQRELNYWDIAAGIIILKTFRNPEIRVPMGSKDPEIVEFLKIWQKLATFNKILQKSK